MSMHWRMKFSCTVIHRLLLRELHHNRPTDEMWFLLGDHLVRFSKVEFYLITGFRFGVVPDTSLYTAVDNGIHQRYFPRADEVSFQELRVFVTLEDFQQAYDDVKIYLIYMLNWILMGLDKRFKIPVWQFRLVEDLAAFDAFRGTEGFDQEDGGQRPSEMEASDPESTGFMAMDNMGCEPNPRKQDRWVNRRDDKTGGRRKDPHTGVAVPLIEAQLRTGDTRPVTSTTVLSDLPSIKHQLSPLPPPSIECQSSSPPPPSIEH
ncbi:hypothetical protein Ddye_021020 [Dipteronia dyeriana]|uniref:DUF1985 domain-containing protein n=1 Tax=Dipteronia dyeriana TaxID=168575 RepID=A0AAD9WXK8_9ROSI|nr:hypothetical protein Ddye_021020 [Dipteronia dyeriana]